MKVIVGEHGGAVRCGGGSDDGGSKVREGEVRRWKSSLGDLDDTGEVDVVHSHQGLVALGHVRGVAGHLHRHQEPGMSSSEHHEGVLRSVGATWWGERDYTCGEGLTHSFAHLSRWLYTDDGFDGDWLWHQIGTCIKAVFSQPGKIHGVRYWSKKCCCLESFRN